MLGFASLMLYTPIGIRIYRQKSANGTTLTTWWLKVASYTVSDIYSYLKLYPLSTYVEVLTITIEAMTILGLVAYYQKKLWKHTFWICFVMYVSLTAYYLLAAPPTLIAASTLMAAGLNSAALVPQFVLNYTTASKGDYSPLTASLAGTGCAIRLWTTHQLTGNDPILYINFGVALILNWALFSQIMYYGVSVEGLSIKQVFCADLGTRTTTPTKRRGISQFELSKLETLETIDESVESLLLTGSS